MGLTFPPQIFATSTSQVSINNTSSSSSSSPSPFPPSPPLPTPPSHTLLSSIARMATTQIDQGFKFEEEFISNRRDIKTYTCRWLPVDREEPKSLIFLCHGYGMECCISMKETGVRLAKAGFAVHGMDYEGHGKTAGLQGYVPSFDAVADDCCTYFASVCERAENKTKRRFLLGESMGGAMALIIHGKMPNYWNGAVLVAPMCKIADEMKPHRLVISVLEKMCHFVPTWKIVPTKDIIDISFKVPEKRQMVKDNPHCYKGKPRLKTGYELLKISLEIEKNLHKVSLPFLVVHGGADMVTDPSVSRLLHESAVSSDKTFKLYPGMWHCLTSGEPLENIELVFSDIVAWLEERSTSTSTTAAAAAGGDTVDEGERKVLHDHQIPTAHAKF